jgi:hypothetical protein
MTRNLVLILISGSALFALATKLVRPKRRKVLKHTKIRFTILTELVQWIVIDTVASRALRAGPLPLVH